MNFSRTFGATVLLALPFLVPSGSEARPREKLPHQYSIAQWSAENGLPDNFISDVLKTRDGYLWIATEKGLCRFDGVTFTIIDRRSHPILLSNRISTLLEDRQGRLWFGTHGGALYVLSADSLRRITQDDGLPSHFVLSLCEAPDGTIWVGTDGKGLGHILQDTIVNYSEAEGLLSRNVNALAFDKKGVLWIGTKEGVHLFQGNTISVYPENHRLPSREVRDIFVHEGTIWIATSAGLCRLQDGTLETVRLSDGSVSATSITRDHQGSFWVGTKERGVYRLHNGSSVRFTHGDPARSGDVRVVYTGSEGNIWIGTERAGLVRLRDEVFTSYTVLDGLPDNFTTSITEGTSGEFWVGSAGGLAVLAEETALYRRGTVPFDHLVQTVALDHEGTLWCGTRSGKLMKLIRGTLVPARLPESEGAPIWVVFPDSKGTLWVGTQLGLYALRGEKHVKYRMRDRHFGLSNDDVRTICEDRDGALWFGASYGLNRFVDGEFTQYTWKNGLSNDVIVSLYPDTTGDLWVGTLGGLNRLRKGRPTSITMEHGLPDDAIACILEDDLGFLWIGTGNGICRIKKAQLNSFLDGEEPSVFIQVFGIADGLKSVKVQTGMQPSGWKARNGTLWFATDEGIASIDPAMITTARVPLAVHVTGIRVDRLVHPNSNRLNIGANHDEIEIAYSAPTFIKPGETVFRYMLEGLSTDWVDAGRRRTAFFSRVPAGEYVFRVQAGNGADHWGASVASIAIDIEPQFWMTWWFQGIFVVMFLSIGPAIYFRRTAQLKRQHAQQEDFSRRLIASQEAERKRIAAELHDSLGQNIIIIKNRALLGKQAEDDKAAVSEQLDEIARTATSTLDDMRKIAQNLRPVNLERFGLRDTIVQTVKDVGTASGIALQAQIEECDKRFTPDIEMHLFRIVQEALNNIVKHAQATTGSVSVELRNAELCLSICDNGRGFDPRSGTHKAGLGLDGIAHRARLIGGELTINSRPGKGTTVTVKLALPENIA